MTTTPNTVLALVLALLALSPAALACGGGGSGSYRKPTRPDHQHQQHSAATQPPQQGATAPQGAPQ